jgi:protein-tyrosine-phosphatase/predicted ATP-grasp superfamily ATP-dependent carboligase
MTDTSTPLTLPKRALVLGDDTRSFLAVVRGLGREDIEVHAAPIDFTSPALTSRYIRQIHRLPAWIGDGAAWLRAIEALLQATSFDVVIPCNETALLPLYTHRERLSRLTRLALPDDEALRVLFDKSVTRALAIDLGIPVAPGRMLRADDSAEAVMAEFGSPIVVKPIQSYKLDSLHRREKVRVVETVDELQKALVVAEPAETLIEGFFPGQGIGVSIFADHGMVMQVFEHHRVREDDGASYYRVSAAIDPAMAEATAKLVKAVGFSGIAMFEFKRRLDGPWILLEVNARPWGSMPLPLALGINFPYLWFRQLVGGEVTPHKAYKVGVYGRNLLPDLKAIQAEFNRRSGLGGKIGYVLGRLWDFRRVLLGSEVHDVGVADDLRPAVSEILQLRVEAFSKISPYLPGYALLCRVRAENLVKRLVGNGGKIIVVCRGNICRSPFAEMALQNLHLPRVSVRSAGTMPFEGRPSPELAVQQAWHFGIDLRSHHSKVLSADDVAGADMIVAFDKINRHDIMTRFPEAESKLIQLGHLIGIDEITDPVMGDEEFFNQVYRLIELSVVKLGNCVQSS